MSLPICERASPCWLGDALTAGPHGLDLVDSGHIAELVKNHQTIIYGTKTFRFRIGELRNALGSSGDPFRIHNAMKAARFGPVLEVIRRERDVGIDTCSLREVERELAFGSSPSETSVMIAMPSLHPLSEIVQITGNFNEANDVFGRPFRLSRLDERDLSPCTQPGPTEPAWRATTACADSPARCWYDVPFADHVPSGNFSWELRS